MTISELEDAAKGCRAMAEECLDKARREWAYEGPDPSRPVLIAEAQAYATLALAYSTAHAAYAASAHAEL